MKTKNIFILTFLLTTSMAVASSSTRYWKGTYTGQSFQDPSRIFRYTTYSRVDSNLDKGVITSYFQTAGGEGQGSIDNSKFIRGKDGKWTTYFTDPKTKKILQDPATLTFKGEELTTMTFLRTFSDGYTYSYNATNSPTLANVNGLMKDKSGKVVLSSKGAEIQISAAVYDLETKKLKQKK